MSYGSNLHQFVYYNSPLFFKNCISSIYGLLQIRKRYGKYFFDYFNDLIRNQWYPQKTLEEIQFRETKRFLINAYHYTEFYNSLFSTYDFNPEKMTSFSELGVLPILNKSNARKNISKIVNSELQKYNVHLNRTSGTTGASLSFPESIKCYQREYAYRYLQYSWGDCHQGQKFAFCVGHPVTYKDRKSPPFWVYDFANNWLCLSSFHLNEKNIHHYISELDKFQPALLQGYPSSMYLLAVANNHYGNKIKPRAIFTSSETLFDFQRSVIEQSFNCKVFNYYGNSERCGFVSQCEEGNYHMMLQHSYIELLSGGNLKSAPGRNGHLVCTGFGNYATPFIRYDIEDIAVLSDIEKCSCGRGGILLETIVGRTDDYILTPDGRFIGRLTAIFHNSSKIRIAQIVQHNVNEVIIRIVKEDGYNSKDENSILLKARSRLGTQIRISFEYVPDIPRTNNGKHRFILSKINKKQLFEHIVEEQTVY